MHRESYTWLVTLVSFTSKMSSATPIGGEGRVEVRTLNFRAKPQKAYEVEDWPEEPYVHAHMDNVLPEVWQKYAVGVTYEMTIAEPAPPDPPWKLPR